jgi:hypothetical protein
MPPTRQRFARSRAATEHEQRHRSSDIRQSPGRFEIETAGFDRGNVACGSVGVP